MHKILWFLLLGALVAQVCALPDSKDDKAKGEADAAKAVKDGAKSAQKKAGQMAEGAEKAAEDVEKKAKNVAKGAGQKAEEMAEDAEDMVTPPKKHNKKHMDDEDCDAKPKHPHGGNGMIGALISTPFEMAKKGVETAEGIVMGGVGIFGGFGGVFGF